METKMWSYNVVWDTMFASNPIFDILTLATCKSPIRNCSKFSDYKSQIRSTCNNNGCAK